MRTFLFPLLLIFLFTDCDGGNISTAGKTEMPAPADTPVAQIQVPPPLAPFDTLIFEKTELLKSSSGTKSVVFSKDKKHLYALNLEGMSVYEFSQASGKVTRIFKFRRTPGTGWDYTKEKPIPSFQEKPVEGFVSNHDSILWVSLHNAEGIVPLHLMTNSRQRTALNSTDKLVYLIDSNKVTVDSFYVPLIKTGKTPKIISGTSDDRYLLVSNWHSYNVSVLEKSAAYPFAKVIKDVDVSRIPRGIVVDEAANKSYVAIMGGSAVSAIDNGTWTRTGDIQVEANPRHILQGKDSRLLISYNKISKIGCVDPVSGKTLFTAKTASQPRTMALSADKRFLFVTCYSGNKMMLFEVLEDRFELLSEQDCSGNPVGVDIFEDDARLQAWVCSYETGMISIYHYKKK